MQAKRSGARAIFSTGLLFLLVFLALSDRGELMGLLLAPILAVIVAAFLLLFPGSRFFAISLANYCILYACIFVFVSEANFGPISPWLRPLGFALPLAAFLGGAILRRSEINAVIGDTHLRQRGRPQQVFGWLVPIIAIGLLTFALPRAGLAPLAYDFAFLLAMAAIAGIVLYVSRDISIFLIDTGLMFEEFFVRLGELASPVFTFFTFYSLLIVVFASLFRVVDRLSHEPQFVIDGRLRPIDFTESLYFSVVTLSTVGYGDIIPHAAAVRILSAVEIVLGVLLLLFGFAEIRRYSLERSEREHHKR